MHEATIETRTLGEAWLAAARAILDRGVPSRAAGLPVLEIGQVVVQVREPAGADPIAARLGDPERPGRMRADFTGHARETEPGDARKAEPSHRPDTEPGHTQAAEPAHTRETGPSHMRRTAGWQYGGVFEGRGQVRRVVERLRADPSSRSASITTFTPGGDGGAMPWVTLLEFRIRAGAVESVVPRTRSTSGRRATAA